MGQAQRQQKDNPQTATQVQGVSNTSTFDHPILAALDGHPVKLIALGDVEGNSPSYLYVDSEGNSGWASQSEFTIIDTNCLPPSQQTMQQASRSFSGGGTGGGNRR